MVVFKNWGYLLLCFLLALIAIVIVASTINSATRIIGGQDAPDGKYPYMVSLRNSRGRHFCGGSIIDDRWILTAAHCLLGKGNDSITVVAGTNLIHDGEDQVYQSEYIVAHEDYSALPTWPMSHPRNDIGLIRVSEKIKFNKKVRRIKLTKKNIQKPGKPATLTGWGIIRDPLDADTHPLNATRLFTNELQVLETKLVDLVECNKTAISMGFEIDESNICTFTKRGQGFCLFDSGSPLVADRVQIGVASWVKPCARGFPDIYARVYFFLDWIKSKKKIH